MTDGARPGALTPWQYVQNVLFYAHVACATLIIGLFGLPALRHGRARREPHRHALDRLHGLGRAHPPAPDLRDPRHAADP